MILVPFGEDPSKTGRYIFVKELGFLVKVSGKANVCVFDCFCPNGGYWSENIDSKPVYVESRAQKRVLLRERGLREVGSLTNREI